MKNALKPVKAKQLFYGCFNTCFNISIHIKYKKI